MNYTPEQKQAIETIGCHVCVVAGAGTGKTRVLVDRIVHLLNNEEVTLDNIVAITFTRKAASEMKSRLREACRKLATPDDAAAMTFWRTREQEVETARITTIDSFCASLLREQAGRLGLDPDFVLLTESETILMRENAVTTTLLELMEQNESPLHALLPEYGLFAIQNTLMGIVGKGRFPKSDHTNESPEDVADALIETAKKYLRPHIEQIKATLQSYDDLGQKETDKREIYRLLQYAACQGIIDNASFAQQIAACNIALNASPVGTRKTNWPATVDLDFLTEFQKDVKKIIGIWLDLLDKRPAQIESATLTQAFAAVHNAVEKTYAQQKTARSAMDFSDLLNGVNAMFRDYPHLRKTVARQIRYLLIDEFQDTNDTQWTLASHLMRTQDQPGAELFIVGDAKQSIYRFRQADVAVFRNAQDTLDEVIRLQDSFRTLPDVMHFINHLFKKSGMLESVEPEYHSLNPRRTPLDQPQIECWIPPELDPPEKESADQSRKREAQLMAHRIRSLCDPHSPALTHATESGSPRPVEYGDIAILFRTKSNFLLYEQVLREYGIPTRLLSGSGFYKRQEIIDIRNLLHVVHNPWNESALLAFLRSPLCGLDDNSIYLLNKSGSLIQAYHEDTSLEDTEQHTRLKRSRNLITDLRSKRDWPLPAFLRYILRETYLEAVLLSLHHGVQKAGNVRRLIEMAQELSHIEPITLSTFLHHLEQLAAQDVREAEATLHAGGGGAVSIMSIHASKGLEFPVVILADTSSVPGGGNKGGGLKFHPAFGSDADLLGDDGHLEPSPVGQVIRFVNKAEEEAEAARVLYVALTRAQDRLVVSGGPKPTKSSWLATIDNQVSLTSREDGDVVQGDGWGCTVYRHAESPPKLTTSESEKSTAPDIETLTKRAESVLLQHSSTSLSVTEFIRQQSDTPAEDHPHTAAQHHALLRGTILHRLMETWDFANEVQPHIESLLQTEFPSEQIDPETIQNLKTTLDRFADSDLYKQLQSVPTIQKEILFTLNLDTCTLNGTIDALLPDGTILDYKTGHPNPGLKEKYRRQLCIYAAAVQLLQGTPPKTGLIYYLDTDESTKIDFTKEDLPSYLRPSR